MDLASIEKNGAPYPSLTAELGLEPSTSVDVPICAVFLALYITGAISHMTIYQLNNRRKHKFIPSVAVFGFCMARTLTCSLRIAWAYKLDNIQLSIAATIFANAGMLVLFVVDLLFAQRCLCAAFPRFGWNKLLRYAFLVLYLLIPCVLVLVIVTIVYTHYTLNPSSLNACRDALLVGGTYLSLVSFLPLLLIVGIIIIPKGSDSEDFGTGSWAAKLLIVGITSLLLCFGEVYRTAVNYMPSRMATDPYAIEGKASFYVVFFVIEILVVYTFLFTRVDKRFWIPNGSEGTFATVEYGKDSNPSSSE